MKEVITGLSHALKQWGRNTHPINRLDDIAIAHLDRSCTSQALDTLFFEQAVDAVSASGPTDLTFFTQEVLRTGTLRNSFYPEVFIQHSNVSRSNLCLNVTGNFLLEINYAQEGALPVLLQSARLSPPDHLDPEQPYSIAVPVDLRRDIPKNARLFWHLRALSDNACFHTSSWQAQAPKSVEGRMVVVLRTFGRTEDITTLLQGFAHDAQGNADFQHMLANTFFLVLDTSPGVAGTDYEPVTTNNTLNCMMFDGPNMGGGGNMSLALLALDEAAQASGTAIDELLLLDDDLFISTESLYRHWASTLFRTDATIFTLPVFMKSEPRKMWEDGAFWGRFLDQKNTSTRNTLAPRLLRHGLAFNGSDHIDTLARPHYPEYSTFIFQSMPFAQFRKLGYPSAFFLRGDDIEYSLRQKAAGGRTFSNPNLAAWHEPAHSYGQEYMSIVHGMIINMAYGQDKADDFVAFFSKRALAHSSLSDIRGLRLYAAVLRDLIGREQLLEHNFANHYVEKLKYFKSFDADFEYIPDEVIDTMVRLAHERGDFIARYGFLHMPIEGNPALSGVILENPHSGNRCVYDPNAADICRDLASAAHDFFGLIAQFADQFNDIKAHYRTRLKAVSTRDFWIEELKYHPAPSPLCSDVISQIPHLSAVN